MGRMGLGLGPRLGLGTSVGLGLGTGVGLGLGLGSGVGLGSGLGLGLGRRMGWRLLLLPWWLGKYRRRHHAVSLARADPDLEWTASPW